MVKTSSTKSKTHKISYTIILILFIVIAVVLTVFFVKNWQNNRAEERFQASLESFYTPPSPLPSTEPGTLIRSEKINVSVPRNGTAYRILYVTQTPNKTPVVSSGMIFLPNKSTPVPDGGRKIVAWAHGTLGFGNECTPSRSMSDTLRDMDNWLDGAMQRGYVVAATDYTGVGTTGNRYYLIGKSEAYDVLNSVRAARNLPDSQASQEFVTWGHSQGGHSAIYAALESETYAPELTLKGVAAAAPAAELSALFSQQYDKKISWGIGPDVAESWPNVYPNLNVNSVLSESAKKDYKKLANGCVTEEILGIEIRNIAGQSFFSSDPMQQRDWEQTAKEQTPNISAVTTPIYIAQGMDDQVVLPNTTALLVEKACKANRQIAVNWLGNMNHQLTAVTAGPSAIAWMQDRFNDQSAQSSCQQPLPVDPAT